MGQPNAAACPQGLRGPPGRPGRGRPGRLRWASLGAAVALTVAVGSPGARGALAAVALPSGPEGYVLAARGLISGGVQSLAPVPAPGGQAALAVGFADRVELGWAGAGWAGFFSFRSIAVAAGATALAAADLDGSGQEDLVVGTGGAGSLLWVPQVLAGGSPVRASGFVFGTVRQVMAAELDGAAPMELLAVNAAGELFVFAAGPAGVYRRVWASAGAGVLSAAAGDVDGDGIDEVVVGQASGAVQVLRWTGGRLEAVAVGYPWGEPVAVAVARAGPGGTGRPVASPGRLVVVTSRRVAYAYHLEGRSMVADWLGGHDRLALGWIRAAALTAPPGATSGGVVFEGSGAEGIQVFRLDGAGLSLLAHAQWPGPSVRFARLSGGVLVVVRPDGSVDQLQTVSAGYLDLQVSGRTVRPPAVAWEGDTPLLPTAELGRLLGIQVSQAPGANSALLASGRYRVRVEAGNPRVLGPQLSLYLPQPPVRRGERLYVPPEALQALGWAVRYEPEHRRLQLNPPAQGRGDGPVERG